MQTLNTPNMYADTQLLATPPGVVVLASGVSSPSNTGYIAVYTSIIGIIRGIDGHDSRSPRTFGHAEWQVLSLCFTSFTHVSCHQSVTNICCFDFH